MKLGKVYLVGAGPGAADLITLRGAKLLAKADIVFHDALIEQELLDLCPQAIKVAVGKRCGKLSTVQHFINKRLVDAAQQFQIIVRLKGGDPMLFGRADEELSSLRSAGLQVEVIPGVTAALASAASIQQSLTLRGIARSVAFVTLAQGSEYDNANTVLQHPIADTLVYYMGRKDATLIAQQLIDHSPNQDASTTVHILESVSTPNERIWTGTLSELAAGRAQSWFNGNLPTLILIGKALKNLHHTKASECSSPEIDNRLQDSLILSDRRGHG